MDSNYEHHEQVALFQWAKKYQVACPELEAMFAVPNGGDRNPVVAKKLKAEGVKAGVPDFFLPVARGGYHGLVIELKRIQGGTVSKEQKWWLQRFSDEGYRAVVCRGWIEAKDEILGYLGYLENMINLPVKSIGY